MFIANTRKFLNIIWPMLSEWANVYNYSLPEIHYMESIVVRKVSVITNSTINSVTVGQYSNSNKQIKLLFPGRTKRQKILTLAHEYAHVIQHYNLKNNYTTRYSKETNKHGYKDNKFEVEARFMSQVLDCEYTCDTKIAKQLVEFNWLFTDSKKPRTETNSKSVGRHWQPYQWYGKFQGYNPHQ